MKSSLEIRYISVKGSDEVIKFLVFQVLASPRIGFSPQAVIYFRQLPVGFVMLEDFVIKHHYQLREVLVVCAPLLEGAVEGVFHGRDAESVCDGEVLPEGRDRVVAEFFFDSPPWDI